MSCLQLNNLHKCIKLVTTADEFLDKNPLIEIII